MKQIVYQIFDKIKKTTKAQCANGYPSPHFHEGTKIFEEKKIIFAFFYCI
jgi:hypothetical protein